MKKEITLIIYGLLGLLVAILLVIFFPIGCKSSKTTFMEGFTTRNFEKCVFNSKKYADMYPDLKKAFGYDETKLREHYLEWGMKEGRSPCGEKAPNCSWSEIDYLFVNTDVKDFAIRNQINPTDFAVQHYKQYGIYEGRSPCPSIAVRKFGTCPRNSKVFTDKNGNINCCKGTVTGNTCEGQTVCTFSSSNSSKIQMCD